MNFYKLRVSGRERSITLCVQFADFTSCGYEPCDCVGTWRDVTWPDNWTSVTQDGRLSAQFEHTLLVTESGCDVLTKRLDRDGQPYFMDNLQVSPASRPGATMQLAAQLSRLTTCLISVFLSHFCTFAAPIEQKSRNINYSKLWLVTAPAICVACRDATTDHTYRFVGGEQINLIFDTYS